MNILVTGSEGRIGKYLVQMLLQAGHSLRTLDIHARPPHPGIEHIPGNVRDLALVRRAVRGMEAVCHLGAIPFDFSDEEVIFTSNVQGTWNVLQACKESGVARVVNFSSINALGRVGEHPQLSLPVDDNLPHRVWRQYELSKHLGEEMCRAFASNTLKIISLRPTLVTQAGAVRSDFYRRWLTRTSDAEDLVRHQCDLWSYVDVDDVCQAALLSLTAPFEPYDAFLLAADDTMMSIPTAELVQRLYPATPWPRVSPDEYLAGDPFRGLIDCSHAKQVLGWQPKVSWRTSGVQERKLSSNE